MVSVSRADDSIVGRWWWSVDRWTLAALLILISVGALLSFSASPAVARSSGLGLFSLAQKHLFFLPLAAGLMVAISMFTIRQVRIFSFLLLFGTIGILLILPLIGNEFNGSTRWLSVGGISLQPSEFVKPAFAVTAAWLISQQKTEPGSMASIVVFSLYGLLLVLLFAQPDLGQSLLISAIFFVQLFLAGLSLIWIATIIAFGCAIVALAYFSLGHVQSRINMFFSGEMEANYQVAKSLKSFMNGGLFGKGPGEGEIKSSLPDAHSDFVFAVLGEEFGLIACFFVLGVIAFVLLQGVVRALSSRSLFIMLAMTGLLTQFGLQAFVNMATSLNMMPTKGMTLPFISYGGSSMMAIGIAMGLLLALGRRGAWESAGQHGETSYAQPYDQSYASNLA